jgi:hypothetical protein
MKFFIVELIKINHKFKDIFATYLIKKQRHKIKKTYKKHKKHHTYITEAQ